MFTHFEIHQFPLWDRLREKRIPLSFDLELTARCNFNCRHCYINLPADDVQAKDRELTLEEIRHIARKAVQMGAVWCLITGGEPLLRKDFPDIYLLLKRLGLLVSVFTNASLVTSEHARLFKKYPPRDIEVTVYGASKETFEQVTRRSHSFESFLRGLQLLLNSGIRVRLKNMVIRSNRHEFDEISSFCLKHTKDYYRSDPFLCLRNDRDPARNAEIRAERLTPMEIIAIGRAERRSVAGQPAAGPLLFPEQRDAPDNALFRCGAGQDSFTVGYDGRLRLCSALCRPDCVYDLRRGDLSDAWQDFVPAVRERCSTRTEYRHACGRCELARINLCRWCPANSYLETGEMDRPVDYFCQIAHAEAASLGIRHSRSDRHQP